MEATCRVFSDVLSEDTLADATEAFLEELGRWAEGPVKQTTRRCVLLCRRGVFLLVLLSDKFCRVKSCTNAARDEYLMLTHTCVGWQRNHRPGLIPAHPSSGSRTKKEISPAQIRFRVPDCNIHMYLGP
jgi:hypothetical protein